jgi:hypothetical protein
MQHLGFLVLWEFRSGKETLLNEALKHFADCDDCMTAIRYLPTV